MSAVELATFYKQYGEGDALSPCRAGTTKTNGTLHALLGLVDTPTRAISCLTSDFASEENIVAHQCK